MKIHSPLFLLVALGVLSAGASLAAPAADLSAWTCSKCPYPQGATGEVAAGLTLVSDDSATFGDTTGLQRSGAHLALDGELLVRTDGGLWADVRARDLGLASRTLAVQGGREGQFMLRLGFSELPRHFGDGARSPFLGSGSAQPTLPAGYPAASTAGMPLAGTLQPVAPGFRYQRFDLGGTWFGADRLSLSATLRHDVRDGSRRGRVSFFANAAELVLPVDQVTDQLELAAQYGTSRWQARVAYQLSQFRQGIDAVTVANPFNPVTGDTSAQLAQAPDNQFHQLLGSAAYQVLPSLRASADVALGRLTQNQAYLKPTTNAGLGTVTLPQAALDGRIDTFNGSVRVSAEPADGLRLVASYARDVRDNRTRTAAYPLVAADMFVNPGTRINTPFSFWQDRWALQADLRGPGTLRLAGGVVQDNRERDYTEVVTTRETSGWARASLQPLEGLTLTLKLSGADRGHSTYGRATWFGAPENPLLRKYNLAARERLAGSLRIDWALNENVALGFSAEQADDDYHRSAVGLQSARSGSLGADLSVALSEQTRFTAFAQTERIRARQAGSQVAAAPDWTGRSTDDMDLAGIGVKHSALGEKLDLGADYTWSRARSRLLVQTGVLEPAFPQASVAHDRLKLYAGYKLSEQLTLQADLWFEDYRAADWRLDGVLPATVGNLLSLGQQAARYRLTVGGVSLRYRF